MSSSESGSPGSDKSNETSLDTSIDNAVMYTTALDGTIFETPENTRILNETYTIETHSIDSASCKGDVVNSKSGERGYKTKRISQIPKLNFLQGAQEPTKDDNGSQRTFKLSEADPNSKIPLLKKY